VGNVHNSYATQLERGLSVTDQRHRFVAFSVYQSPTFRFDSRTLSRVFNNWQVSTVFSAGSGRPINATIAGDSKWDDNIYDDRLPGVVRNDCFGLDDVTLDVRISKSFPAQRAGAADASGRVV
jgi:hypothetical protein